MTGLKLVQRKVTISQKQAVDGKFLAGMKIGAERLGRDAWFLSGDNYTRLIDCPQIVVKEHEEYGVPDVEGIEQSDVIDAVNTLMVDGHVDAETLAKVINNGLYLHFNAKAKPKKGGSMDDIQQSFAANSSDADKLAYFAAMAKGSGSEFLKAWYAKQG